MKNALSLLELCLVIIILSLILALGKVFLTNDERLILAARQVCKDLNYARNLALMQDSFRSFDNSVAKDEWFKARWQVYFIRSKLATNNEQTYTIFLDKNGDGNANIGKIEVDLDREIAVDVMNSGKFMNSGQSGVIDKDDEKANARFNLEQTFGVSEVEFKGACEGYTRVIFDEFARINSPLRNANRPYERVLFHKNQPCIIKLLNAKKQSVCIVVDALSGYAFVPPFTSKSTQMLNLKGKQKECAKL